MKWNKYLAIIVAIILSLTNLLQIAHAAETTNEKIARLQKKYGINIVMDEAIFYENGTFKIVNSNVKGIPKEWVDGLEEELRYIPTALNSHVRKNVKQPLTFRFLKMHESVDGFYSPTWSGYYNSGNNTIYSMFGLGILSFAHEYGHMLDYYFLQHKKNFQNQWKKYNGNVPYGSDYHSLTEKQQSAFVRDYALISIREDIADTFDMLAHGSSPYVDGKAKGGLAKKLTYLEKVFEEMIGKEDLFPNHSSQAPAK